LFHCENKLNPSFLVSSCIATVLICLTVLLLNKPNDEKIKLPEISTVSLNEQENFLIIQKPIENKSPVYTFLLYFLSLGKKFKSSYSNYHVLNFSLWWALAQAGVFQIANYVQNLWLLYQPADQNVYNGYAQACSTLSSLVFKEKPQ